MARELEHIRMGQLVEGDWLVREDAIGTVLVRGVVKPPGRRCTVLYVKDGDVREYPTWKSTHARAMRGAGPLPDAKPDVRSERPTLGRLR